MSLIVRDKVSRQCPQTTTFEEKGEPKRYRTEVPLLTTRPNRLTPHKIGPALSATRTAEIDGLNSQGKVDAFNRDTREIPSLLTSVLFFTSVQTASAHWLADSVHPFAMCILYLDVPFQHYGYADRICPW